MAHIKEPKGVDFIIKSEPLTAEARKEISDFIRNYKSKATPKKNRSKASLSKKKSINQ